MLRLWQSVDADEAGVCLLPKVELSEELQPQDEFWSEIPVAFQITDKEQTRKLVPSGKYK